MKTIKKIGQWTLAITIALALKFGLLYCYSAYNFRQSAQGKPKYEELKASYNSGEWKTASVFDYIAFKDF